MKQKIEAGALANALNTIEKISDSLFRFFDKLLDYGVEVTKEEKTEDGGVKIWCNYGGQQFDIIGTPVVDENGNKTGNMNVVVHCNHKDISIENIKESEIEGKVMRELQKQFGSDFGKFKDDASSSRKLQVTLQKILSAKESEIKLTAIQANYNITAANAALDMVLDNIDFLDAIPEEPTSFEITDMEDDFHICSIPEVDLSGICTNLAQAALQAWCKFSSLAWNSTSPAPPEVFDIKDCLMQDVDYFAEASDWSIGVNPYGEAESNVDFHGAVEDLEYYLLMLDTYQIDFPIEIQDEITFMMEELKELLEELSLAPELTIKPEEDDVF